MFSMANITSMLPRESTIIQSTILNALCIIQLFITEKFEKELQKKSDTDPFEYEDLESEDLNKQIIEIAKLFIPLFAVQIILLIVGSVPEATLGSIANYFGVIAQNSSLEMALNAFAHYFKLFCIFLPFILAIFYIYRYTTNYSMKRKQEKEEKKIACLISITIGFIFLCLMIQNYSFMYNGMIKPIMAIAVSKTPRLAMFISRVIFYMYTIAEGFCLTHSIYSKGKNFRENRKLLLAEGVYLSILAIAMGIVTLHLVMSTNMLLDLLRALSAQKNNQ
ncbi:hypothetical protein NEMIN01_2092 [Nematocida minor]|uniref:uncharacterized protein n=1 Tax=Nematocida minor TaxID=1912983 RepID=UPI00221FD71F|nr:uncharacterized protein NEMIN01_2092 [Nematocida minor]KAI5192579.1 hypothetical protein NEMIN01_2092 [Nematocida minor]